MTCKIQILIEIFLFTLKALAYTRLKEKKNITITKEVFCLEIDFAFKTVAAQSNRSK